jgi:hypothetical protein
MNGNQRRAWLGEVLLAGFFVLGVVALVCFASGSLMGCLVCRDAAVLCGIAATANGARR